MPLSHILISVTVIEKMGARQIMKECVTPIQVTKGGRVKWEIISGASYSQSRFAAKALPDPDLR